MAGDQVSVKEVPTKPIQGQKTGTSGLRKKTKEFMSENYLANWVQSLFNALGDEKNGKVLGLGGDGRYFGKEAAQIIIKLAAGNGFSKVVVGQNALMATPAMSALIIQKKLYGECLYLAIAGVPALSTAGMLSAVTQAIRSHQLVAFLNTKLETIRGALFMSYSAYRILPPHTTCMYATRACSLFASCEPSDAKSYCARALAAAAATR
jgi:hypothetical protein